MDQMPQLPTSVYVVIGVMVVFNLGTIVTVVVCLVKGGYWLGKKLTEIDGKANEGVNSAKLAHQRINGLTGERTNSRTRG